MRWIDRISVKDREYEELDVIEQELILQADSSDFQTVINRLENKGQGYFGKKILKLDEMRLLRKKAGQKTKD